ncbi:calcium-binding mitochondrial carrier protein Aralar1 isoform X2 [Folsomia candida]|uniref:calcium-binding mitochondrial carrier protein Aralar1 isoform X2 n=1 Tax=Folsomia candida TaxID=158441 RepID=UPI001604E1E0|nr:calcium-binding mitochondrial carrier protein Aralar1 isoform X2 [Folsomia candida]
MGWEKPRRIERAHRSDLLDIFHKYSQIGANGYRFIKSTDLITKYFGLLSTAQHDQNTVELLAGIIDTSKDGYISFSEFVTFEGLLTVPDALYFTAFRLFDTNGNGKVTFDEFKHVISHTTLQKMMPFNMNGNFVRMYFGRRKNRVVTYAEFSQFLHDFHEEYATEAFRRFDPDCKGTIPISSFVSIMTNLRSHLVQPKVGAHLEAVARQLGDGESVSYPFFVAFNSLLNNMELMKKVYLQASRGLPSTEITKHEFLSSGQVMSQLTPLQVDILFTISQLINDSPTLILSDLQSIAPEQYYIKVENRVLDIKAVRSPEERGYYVEFLESVYRFCIGLVAGLFESVPTYPMDLVKTRMQNQRPSKLISSKIYSTNVDCLLKIRHVEGMRGLYRGLAPHVIGSSLGKAFKLSMNDWIRDHFMNRKGQVPFPAEVFAGACAGLCSAIVVNPLEIIKIRMQDVGQLFPHSKFSMLKLIRRLGFKGMYQGMTACMMRDVPFSAIFFPGYAHMKLYLQDEDGYNSPFSLLVAGATATIPAVPISMPFDVIKTRLQVVPKPGEIVYTGTLDCALRIYREEGYRSFMQGTRVIKPTQVGLALLVYEVLQRWFYVDFAGTRPTGSEKLVQITSVDQLKSENPDHIGGYALALPILAGIESKFGLVFPKFKNQVVHPLI